MTSEANPTQNVVGPTPWNCRTIWEGGLTARLLCSALSCASAAGMCTLLLPTLSALAGEGADKIDTALAFTKAAEGKVYRQRVEPHWLPGGPSFWYSIATGPQTREWVLVHAETGEIQRVPDKAGLALPSTPPAASLDRTARSRASDERTHLRFRNQRTAPVELFWVDPQGKRQTYGTVAAETSREMGTFAGHVWAVVDTVSGADLLITEAPAEDREIIIARDQQPLPPPKRPRESGRNASPDGRWEVRFDLNQVLLRDTASGETSPLTTDGTEAQTYLGPASWSPDGQCFVVRGVKPVARRQVTEVQSSPPDALQPRVRTFEYLKPGDELPQVQPVLFRLADRQPQRIDTALFPTAFTPDATLPIRWSPQSDEFYFDYNRRGHQLYRILAVATSTGTVRTVVEESSPTFIDYTNKTWRHWLPGTGELLWMSERSGWCHLYLYDVATGAVKNAVTSGAWVVREVLRVDEEARTVWFLACGRRAGEDPYHLHLCRVQCDGTGLQQLTEGDGNHAIEFSPDQKTFLDRWSRADQPPITELRHSADGHLLATLEKADATALLATGWVLPERFVAPGRDGHTEIHGLFLKPSHFDPTKRYPVLEEVYAGPHGAFAAKDFGLQARQHALAELGFIVVQADGMGTNHRGKAFHEVAWQNLQDAGFPDRIAWLRAAARTRPWMDLTRVGIYGGSAGGQNAMRALLDHADFYQAAFADCGCHDNRMDKIWWNEQWLGWPLGPAYERASNVVDAGKLRGALMLSVGELDTNVDPASTMQVVNALEKAGKPFELLVMTNSNHGSAESPYGSRRRMDFFLRHLQGMSGY